MSSLASVLDGVAQFMRRFVVLTRHQADAMALHIAHTHAFAAAWATPYIRVTSAVRESGKTRLLEVLELLVARPWFTGHVTAAVLVRKIDAATPTLLLDETDKAFAADKEYTAALAGVLNTGYRYRGRTSLCVAKGKGFELIDFSTFCPKVFAGLKRLPDTVESRSIPIILKRRKKDEPIERFRQREAEVIGAPLRQWLEEWATGAVDELRDARPNLPDALGDRAADVWEPLIAIADLAGGNWPHRARDAALILSAGIAQDEQQPSLRLLADLRRVFEEKMIDHIATDALIDTLCEDDSAPWGEWRGKRITPHAIAKLLKSFEVEPEQRRVGPVKLRGYFLDRCLDAFARNLPPAPLEAGQLGQALMTAGESHSIELGEHVAVPISDNGESPRLSTFVPLVPLVPLHGEGVPLHVEGGRHHTPNAEIGQVSASSATLSEPATAPATERASNQRPGDAA